MALPTTIRAVASAEAINTVTRLFNGSLTDITNELLQNARRGQAREVAISYNHDTRTITFQDDGHGIASPRALLSLGSSAWGGHVMSEDPAGMGFFSAAGLEVRVSSRGTWPGTSKPFAWAATIGPDDWTGTRDIPLETDAAATRNIQPGTRIEIALADPARFPFLRGGIDADRAAEESAKAVRRLIEPCAKHYSLAVRFNGEAIESRTDILADCEAVHGFGAYRIGVRPVSRSWAEHAINFHGLTISAKLPEIREVWGPHWTCKVDVLDARELQLVLPARKELVQNQAWDQLHADCLIAIYRTIAARANDATNPRPHSLAFEHYLTAAALDIDLPPAEASLFPWAPADPSGSRTLHNRRPIAPQTATVIEPANPNEESAIALALESSKTRDPSATTPAYFLAQHQFEGYAWYDAIPKYRLSRVEVIETESSAPVDILVSVAKIGSDAFDAAVAITAQDRIVERITLCLTGAKGRLPNLALDTPAFITDEGYDFDENAILLARDHAFTPNGFAGFASDSSFCASDDPECDSHHTQLERFQEDAIGRFLTLTADNDAALRHQIAEALKSVQWAVPEDGRVTITMTRTGRAAPLIEVTLDDLPAAAITPDQPVGPTAQ